MRTKLNLGARGYAVLLALFTLSTSLLYGENLEPGHSGMGSAFNEGPRQAAYLMTGTGEVHLEITTSSKEAQRFFNQGIGQLHGFWFYEAERSFRQALKLDPECTMAIWGMAMATITENQTRARGFADKLRTADLSSITEREHLWIKSITNFYRSTKDDKKDTRTDERKHEDFITDLESIIYEYPEEIEAKAFVGGFSYHWRGTFKLTSRAAIDALLKDVLEETPNHPVHHYRIHLWDSRASKRTLNAAGLSGPSAPNIAHMWHMPGHVYSALGRWRDAAWQQEAASRVDHSQMIRDRLIPDEIQNYSHNQEWLVRNYQLIGDATKAVAIAEDLIENPRHPDFNTLANRRGSAYYGRTRFLDTLIKFELWEELVSACQDGRIEPTSDPVEQGRRLRALALAHTHLEENPRADAVSKNFATLISKRRAVVKKLQLRAEKKATKQDKTKEEVKSAGKSAIAGKLRDLERWEKEVKVLALVREGDLEAAEEDLKKSKLDRYQRALLWHQLGDTDQALEIIETATADSRSKLLASALKTWLLEESGQEAQALASFVKLRKAAAHADLSAPAFARLTPIAERAYHPAGSDWRWPAPAAKDLGERPPLASLGPLRWEPLAAPTFSVTTTDGETLDKESLAGQPTILLLFLGHQCSHCVEQIDAFAKMTEEFTAAGIELVGIASEPTEELEKWNTARDPKTQISFPLAGDPQAELFQAFRAYDDFEEMPLHGVFLLDADGRVRWQDISADPFTDGAFVLREAKRLLKLHDPERLAG